MIAIAIWRAPTINRLALAFQLMAVAAAMIVLSPAVTQARAASTVPVIRCPTTFGIAGMTPHAPAQLTVGAGDEATHGLDAYTNSDLFLLGPKGMHCSGIDAADGGSQLTLWPRGGHQPQAHSRGTGLTLTIDPACASCRASDACPFFPRLAASLGFPCRSGVPTGEHVEWPQHDLVIFADPPGVAGSGSPSGGADPANGLVGIGERSGVYRATCTLPAREHGICTTVLDYVIERYRSL